MIKRCMITGDISMLVWILNTSNLANWETKLLLGFIKVLAINVIYLKCLLLILIIMQFNNNYAYFKIYVLTLTLWYTVCLVMALNSIPVYFILPSSPLWLSSHNLRNMRRNNRGYKIWFYESDWEITEKAYQRYIFRQNLLVPISSEVKY